MTTIRIFRQENRIVQVEADGHTGFAPHGQDIVCAAVSTVLQTALLGLIRVARVKTETTMNEKKGYLRFRLVETELVSRLAADIILETMYIAVKDFEAGYPKLIKLEDIEDVY